MPVGGNLGSLRIRLALDSQKMTAGLKKAKAGLRDWSKSSLKTIRQNKESLNQLGMAFGAVGAGATAITVGTVREFGKFQHQMREVATLVRGDWEKTIDALSAGVLDLTTQIPHSTDTLTRALYDLLSAGVDTADALETLKLSGMAATAGLSDVATASGLAMGTINALGLQTSDMEAVFDTAFGTVRVGVTTFGELAAAMGNVLAPAAKLDVAVPELYGSIAFLTKMSLSSAESTVALGRAMDALAKQKDKLSGFGVAVFGETGEFVGLLDVIRQIAGVIHGLSAEERANILEEMGLTDIRVARAIVPMVNNLELFEQILGEVEQSSGDMGRAYKKMAGTLQNQTTIMVNSFRAAAKNFGEELEPAFTKLIESGTDLAKRFKDLSPAMQGLIGKGTAIAGGFGLMTAASLMFLARLPDMLDGFRTLGKLLPGLPGLITPVGLAITAAALATAVIVKRVKEYRSEMKMLAAAKTHLEVFTEGQEDAATAMNQLAGVLNKGKPAIMGTTVVLLPLEESSKRAAAAMAALGGKTVVTEEKFEALKKSFEGTEGFITVAEAAKRITAAIEKANEEIARAASGTKSTDAALKDLRDTLSKLASKEIPDFGRSTQTAFADAMKGYEENFSTLGGKVGNVLDQWEAKDKAFNANRLATARKSAEARISLADSTGKTLALLNAKTQEDRQQKIAAIDAQIAQGMQQFRSEQEAKAGEYNQKILDSNVKSGTANVQANAEVIGQIRQANLEFHANEIGSLDAQILLVQRKYEEMRMSFEKHGGDLVALEQWKNAEIAKLQEAHFEKSRGLQEMHWTQFAQITNTGIGNLADTYIGFYELLNNLDMTDEQIKGKAIVRLARWVDKQAQLLSSLMQLWKNATTIIAKVSQWVGGGQGGGGGALQTALTGANLAGIAGGGGVGAGTLAGTGTAGAGLLGKIGGGIKAGAGKIGGAIGGINWGTVGATATTFAPLALGLGVGALLYKRTEAFRGPSRAEKHQQEIAAKWAAVGADTRAEWNVYKQAQWQQRVFQQPMPEAQWQAYQAPYEYAPPRTRPMEGRQPVDYSVELHVGTLVATEADRDALMEDLVRRMRNAGYIAA